MRALPHQTAAVEACVAALRKADRAQCIMACGTGKTLTAKLIAEAMGAQLVVVFVPTIALADQTVNAWRAAGFTGPTLAVCSDVDAGAKRNDGVRLRGTDLHDVTTDPAVIAAFLRGTGPRLMLCTYHSSPRLAEAMADASVPGFDLAVLDEAHRCAGNPESEFTTALDEARIRAAKRLAMTATPRDMDEDRFGPEAFRYRFGEGIRDGVIRDYRVAIIGVTDPSVIAHIQEGAGSDWAKAAAVLKTMALFDVRRVVTYHRTTKNAQAFAGLMGEVNERLPAEDRPAGALAADYVTGVMPMRKRMQRMDILAGADGYACVSNARCLTEGVDVPTIDCVAFIDARRSAVDITQAIGRAIRRTPDMRPATILIPVFVPEGVDADKAVRGTAFRDVRDVAEALRGMDERFDSAARRFGCARGDGAESSGAEAEDDDAPEVFTYRIGDRVAAAIRPVLMNGGRGIDWDAEPLGHEPDCATAVRLGVSVETVTRHRRRRGIPKFPSVLQSGCREQKGRQHRLVIGATWGDARRFDRADAGGEPRRGHQASSAARHPTMQAQSRQFAGPVCICGFAGGRGEGRPCTATARSGQRHSRANRCHRAVPGVHCDGVDRNSRCA